MSAASFYEQLSQIVAFSLLPLLAAISGAAIAARHPTGAGMRSNIQHLAAGVVFSVVAVEILPGVTHRQHPLLLTIGFSLGVALMPGLEWYSARTEKIENEEVASGSNISLLVALGRDVLACSSPSASGREHKPASCSRWPSLSNFSPPHSHCRAPLAVRELRPQRCHQRRLFSLLFLVTEELLVEAHKESETPFSTALFFIGFLVFSCSGWLMPLRTGVLPTAGKRPNGGILTAAVRR